MSVAWNRYSSTSPVTGSWQRLHTPTQRRQLLHQEEEVEVDIEVVPGGKTAATAAAAGDGKGVARTDDEGFNDDE